MISFIVCSVNEKLRDALASNPERTVGVPYEIIAFDNREAALGLPAYYMCSAVYAEMKIFLPLRKKIPTFVLYSVVRPVN